MTVYTDTAASDYTMRGFRQEATGHSTTESVRAVGSTAGTEFFREMLRPGEAGWHQCAGVAHLRSCPAGFTARRNVRDVDTPDRIAAPAPGLLAQWLQHAAVAA